MSEFKERPILFKGPMVNAILNDSKTQTRRIIKPQPEENHWNRLEGYSRRIIYLDCNDGHRHVKFCDSIPQNPHSVSQTMKCPYGKIGDRLWLRETFAYIWPGDVCVPKEECNIEYRADTNNKLPGDWPEEERGNPDCPKWKPSIFMPRWASRINLEITNIRVERLNDISEEDAICEGVLPNCTSAVFKDGRWSVPENNGCPHQQTSDCDTCLEDGQFVEWMKYHPVDGEEYEEPAFSAKESFKSLWDSINGNPKPGKPDHSWNKNPWVWVVEFKKV